MESAFIIQLISGWPIYKPIQYPGPYVLASLNLTVVDLNTDIGLGTSSILISYSSD